MLYRAYEIDVRTAHKYPTKFISIFNKLPTNERNLLHSNMVGFVDDVAVVVIVVIVISNV